MEGCGKAGPGQYLRMWVRIQDTNLSQLGHLHGCYGLIPSRCLLKLWAFREVIKVKQA